VQLPLDRVDQRARLAGGRGGPLDGGGEQRLGLALDGEVDDPRRERVGAAPAPAGRHRLERHLGRQARADQRAHAGREGEAEVDLGQAEPAALAAHRTPVAGEREHRAAAEGVPVDRRGGRHRRRQQPPEDRLHAAEHLVLGGRRRARHPQEVEAVGEDLAAPAQDQAAGPVRALDQLEQALELVEQLRPQAVLARVHARHQHLAVHRLNHHEQLPSVS
jgi:hypothetical protein